MEQNVYIDRQNNIWRYKKSRNGLCLSLEEAGDTLIVVPAMIEGKAVVEIDKKAFLSKKNIKSIVISPDVSEIGDWAFSHAEMLEKVYFPNRKINFGKKMFLGANHLDQVCYYEIEQMLEDEKEQKGNLENFDKRGYKESAEIPYSMTEKGIIIAKMTAFACRFLTDESLMNLNFLDEGEWFAKWDDLLLRFMNRDDLEGYVELFASGEEDYEGKEYDIESYPRERRFEKLRMIYYRLMNPMNIGCVAAKQFEEYIKSHTKGCSNSEAWDLIIEEYSNDLETYKCFAASGGLTEGNFAECFADVQDKNPQIKAYLLKWKEENLEKKVNDEFDLGW